MGDSTQDVEVAANQGPAIAVKSAGPSSPMGAHTPIVELVLRLFVSALTVVSLSLIASDQNFNTVPAFNYLLGTTVLSFIYSLSESLIASYHLASSRQILLPIKFQTYFMFAADLVCSILLLSGSSAAFGVTTLSGSSGNFIAQANGSASLAFLGFLFMLPLVVLSCHRLSILVGNK